MHRRHPPTHTLRVTTLALAVALAACHHAHDHGDAAPAAPRAPLTEAALAIPIAPGQTAAWRAALGELIGPHYAEYAASRTRFGLSSQMTFLQHTPMGDFALIHMTGADVRASFHAMGASQDPWDVQWRKLTLGLHGLDFAQRGVAPELERAYGMEPADGDADAAPPYLFLAPIAPDQVARFRALAAELEGPRHAEYVAARRAIGVRREAVFLETTAMGSAAVFYWRADDPRASLRALAASTAPVDEWLRATAAAVHPVPAGQLLDIALGNTLIAQYPAVAPVSAR